jgi:hypothetical protein
MAPPDNSTGVWVVEDEMFIAGGIKQFLADLAGRTLAVATLAVAMLAERAPKDGALVVTAGRV